MNLVFIGSSRFGLRCLQTCLQLPFINTVGVVTAPKIFAISYRPDGVTNVLHADVSTLAQSHDIQVQTLQRSMNDPGLFETVSQWKPDAFLVVGWYHMVPRNWRDLAPAYGLHASMLPDYSGGSPLVWAMINGESKTGITLFQMDDGVDSGPIAGQRGEPVYLNDTIATLYARIEDRGLDLLKEVLPRLANGTVKLQAQDESRRRIFRQRAPEDGWISWDQSAVVIDRFIRAQTRPYPGAYTSLHGRPLHIWRASIVSENDVIAPGGQLMRQESGRYLVACGNGAIELKEISYDQDTYGENQISRLFRGGGQMLGVSPSCLRSSDPC
jgi:methionyl-tRNA formyltransferase